MTRHMMLAQRLLACLESELTPPTYPYPVPADKVMLRAGEEVTPTLSTLTDECCTGLGWVRIAGIRSRRVDVSDVAIPKCFGRERVLTLELGVARCIPTPGASGILGEDDWADVALKLDEDNGAMERALCCTFEAADNTEYDVFAVQSYEPFGPDGNCVGGRMLIDVLTEACC